ncbi:hypothetical protein [Brevundimonas sp. Root1423]|uniref:hypothetical protein n=1 Tax=Brevundimonas sp. Root1423 TaxID=1736462 RepID=UPI0006FC3165|nr:hypothetical protein [Brevundimonas sp. Root1423]KQY84936.1 hypothetical protein ASD25_07975 [Brevundimonas sp. Root1423]
MLRLILAVAAAVYIVIGAAGAFVARQDPAASAPPPTLDAVQHDLDVAAALTAAADSRAPAQAADEAVHALDSGTVEPDAAGLPPLALTPAGDSIDPGPDVAGRA